MKTSLFSWEPSIDDMCDEYELDNRVCDFDRGSKERERAIFTFNLICKADQGNLYQDENDDGEVMVSWTETIKNGFLHYKRQSPEGKFRLAFS